MSMSAPRRLQRPIASGLQNACYALLRLSGWLTVTMACVIGLWAAFFVMLGQFTFSGTMLHLGNFAARYVAAGAERQDAFRALFWAWSAGLFVAVGFFRRRTLTDLVNQIKEKADGQE
jgi:hypothetical protein